MSSFADFALLASIPSYGGAEILRAQRVLPSGAGPRVHLALFGRSNEVARRVVDVATAAARVEHPALARILEVGRFDGIVYGVADPAEGVDVSSMLIADNTRRRAPPYELALGIATAVARVVVALHETGDAWAAEGLIGLAGVFPGGVGPEVLFLEANGAVRLRVLAAAAADPRAPSAFRAPDATITQASDVYSLGRLLFALLAGDPSGQTAPRLPSSSSLARVLPRLVDARAEDRLDLHDLVDRLEQGMAELGVSPEEAVRNALAGPYRNMVVDAGAAFTAAPRVVDDIRMRLGMIYDVVGRLYPAPQPTVPPPFAALPPAVSEDDVAVFTDAARPAARPPRARTAATMLIDKLPADTAPTPRAPRGRTSPTMIIPDVNALQNALPPALSDALAAASGDGAAEDNDDRTSIADVDAFAPSSSRAAPSPSKPVDKTQLIESGFAPFVPPPPPPPILTPSRPTPPPPGLTVTPTKQAPPSPADLQRERVRPRTESGGVFASAAATAENLVDEPDEHTVMAAPPPPPSLPSLPSNDPIRQRAPTALSDLANAATRLPAGPPPPMMSGDGAADTRNYDENTAVTSNVPDLSNLSVSDDEGVFAGDEPEFIDDGGAFQMVGDAGRTFSESDNPFAGSTRMIPAQALLQARSQSQESGPIPAFEDGDDDQGPPTEMLTANRVQEMMAAAGLSSEEARAPTKPPPPKETTPKPVPLPTPPASVDVSMSGAPVSGGGPGGGPVLIVEAPEGASVLINGTVVGTGKVSVSVDANARAVVKVTMAGCTPWSSVVQMQGRPRVRVRPALTAKK